MYQESGKISKMELFARKITVLKPLTASAKNSILDVSHGSGYIQSNKQLVNDANKNAGKVNKIDNFTEICYIL